MNKIAYIYDEDQPKSGLIMTIEGELRDCLEAKIIPVGHDTPATRDEVEKIVKEFRFRKAGVTLVQMDDKRLYSVDVAREPLGVDWDFDSTRIERVDERPLASGQNT